MRLPPHQIASDFTPLLAWIRNLRSKIMGKGSIPAIYLYLKTGQVIPRKNRRSRRNFRFLLTYPSEPIIHRTLIFLYEIFHQKGLAMTA